MKANGHVFKYGDNVDTDVIIDIIKDLKITFSFVYHFIEYHLENF